MNEWTHDPREILDTYAAVIRANMLTYSIWPGNYFIVVPKQHRQIFAAAGWSKKDIREYVHDDGARARAASGARSARRRSRAAATRSASTRALRSPDDLLVVAAGGPAGGFGAIIPPWYGTKGAGADRADRRRHDDAQSARSPSVRRRRARARWRRRSRALEGAVVGLLDNAKIGTATFYDHVEKILKTRYGVREVMRRRKPDSSRPAPEAMLGELSAADAIVSGIGD